MYMYFSSLLFSLLFYFSFISFLLFLGRNGSEENLYLLYALCVYRYFSVWCLLFHVLI